MERASWITSPDAAGTGAFSAGAGLGISSSGIMGDTALIEDVEVAGSSTTTSSPSITSCSSDAAVVATGSVITGSGAGVELRDGLLKETSTLDGAETGSDSTRTAFSCSPTLIGTRSTGPEIGLMVMLASRDGTMMRFDVSIVII